MIWITETIRSPEIISALITLIGGIIAYFAQPRVKLIWGVTHGFVFTIQQAPPTLAYTKTLIVQNNGRLEAQDVEIHFGLRPPHFQIWPTFQYECTENPEKQFIITIRSLGPREHATLELLSVGVQLPDILRVRSPKGTATEVRTRAVRVYPKWFYLAVSALILFGFYGILQLLIRWIL